jgi:hypothetical protein
MAADATPVAGEYFNCVFCLWGWSEWDSPCLHIVCVHIFAEYACRRACDDATRRQRLGHDGVRTDQGVVAYGHVTKDLAACAEVHVVLDRGHSAGLAGTPDRDLLMDDQVAAYAGPWVDDDPVAAMSQNGALADLDSVRHSRTAGDEQREVERQRHKRHSTPMQAVCQ